MKQRKKSGVKESLRKERKSTQHDVRYTSLCFQCLRCDDILIKPHFQRERGVKGFFDSLRRVKG